MVFEITSAQFRTAIRSLGQSVGVAEPHGIGTHAFRRGMAQDIVDAGGYLAVWLKAGEWKSIEVDQRL